MKTVAALALVLIAAAGGCGRRGPPLAPLQVDPETPRVLPLRQENGAVVVRWYAPRLDSGGDPADLRLRRAIVSYRVLDLHALAAEERASQRQPPEETDEEEPEAAPSADEDAAGISDPESPATEEQAAPDAAALETGEAAPGEETPPPDAEPPGTSEPETEDQPPEVTAPGETAAPEQPPTPEQPPATEEQAPAGGAPPDETEPEPEPEPEPETEQEPETEPAEQEGPDPGEPAGEETGDEVPAETPEPEAEPEPAGVLLDYEDLEFEVLSEIDSEVPGEERVLELPVEPDWIGRRLEITVRYEARGGASEESELQSLDVTGPLPGVEGVLVEVGPRELTIRWQDPRGALGETPLADPAFEVFRRRGEDSERLGRSFGPSQTDADVVWGEEVCYRARLVVAGGAEERVIPDPGPPAPAGPEGEASAGEPPVPDQDAGETPAPGETVEADAVETVAAEPGDPEGEAAPASDEPEAGEAPWTPIPIRVPGTGTSALSVGPMSAEECVVPLDVFPPVPPSDLRLFWRSEQTELSWRDSASTDVAGYHVYRSGPDGAGFQRLTQTLVEQTSYTDAARDPRGAYRYAVTAVDGADPPNESLPSDPATANPR
ncbi:MAG: hypothetical protein OXP70_01525 [Acidobacteriota bacterium]|nr:hypothetical protein [Acidobacteriota bacterium]